MQPRLASVALVPASCALVATSSNLAYIGGAISSPASVSFSVFAACFGLGHAGVLGAVFAVLAVLAVSAMTARYRVVRRHLDHQAELRGRARREAARRKALEPSGLGRQTQYLELRGLVELVERLDATEATRFELQDLLDHFVQLSDRLQRCVDALRIAGGYQLPAVIPITDGGRSKRRRDIQARRIRHRDECLGRIDALHDEIEAVDELIRLVAQRAACPALDPDLEREIERRLWELDEVDAAMRQLSA